MIKIIDDDIIYLGSKSGVSQSDLDKKANIDDVSGSIVSAMTLFLDDTASDIATYNILGRAPDANLEVTDQIVVNNNTVLIESYITDVLGITSIAAGIYSYNFWRWVSDANGVSKLEFRWYSRATNGDETLLYTHETDEINNTSSTYAEKIVTEAVRKTILATDRLVLKIYGKTTYIGNVTIRFTHSGSQRNSHIHTPIESAITNNIYSALALKQDKALIGQTTPESETKAFYLIQSCLKLKSKLNGILGNYISVKATSSGVALPAIAITGTGTSIDPYIVDIQLGTTASNNTAALLALAIIAKAEANAIVRPLVSVVATQVTAFIVQPLTGGVDGTPGYYLEKKGDINNTLWTMVHSISNIYYYWSPDCISANDTTYVSRYDSSLAAIVWKRAVTGTTAGTHTTNNFDSGLLSGEVAYPNIVGGYISSSAGYNLSIIAGFFAGAVATSSFFNLVGQFYSIRTTTASRAELLTRPCIAIIEFTYA